MSKADKNVDWVKELVHENSRITICEVANMLGISYGSVQSILKDNLNMHQSVEQEQNCVNMCHDLHGSRDPEFLLKIITNDEMWVYGYNAETKQVVSVAEPIISTQTARKIRSNVNSTLIGVCEVLFFWGGGGGGRRIFNNLCIMDLFQKDKL
jgi:hypothetical protein